MRVSQGIGPASKVWYSVPASLVRSDPDLDFSPSFRYELSSAYCQLHLLEPHALVKSKIDGRPVRSYFRPSLYYQAKEVYVGGIGPLVDLQNCVRGVARQRVAQPTRAPHRS